MKTSEFEWLVQKVVARSCSEKEFRRVEAAMLESAELRRIYRESFALDYLIQQEGIGEYRFNKREIVPIGSGRRGWRHQTLVASVAAAAALLIVGVFVLGHIWIQDSHLASVRAAPNTQWEINGKAPTNSPLKKGDQLTVDSGTVELTLASGVKGIVQGPASLVMEDRMRLALSHGTASFDVEPKAIGFEVISDRLKVVDLGTTFGMVVSEQKNIAPEVHVLGGKVEATSLLAQGDSSVVAKGRALRRDQDGRLYATPFKPRRFYRELPSDLPVFTVSFPEAGSCKISGTHAAVPDTSVHTIGKTAWVEGPTGGAIEFREPSARVATDWEGALGEVPRTVMAWIRHPKGEHEQRFQTIVGWGDPKIGNAGKFELLLFQPVKKGKTLLRLSFDQFLYTGTTDLADGEWHHVAAVFKGPREEPIEMVNLYIDGKREKLDPQYTEFTSPQMGPQTLSSGWPMMIGELPQRDQPRTFRGAIGEVQVYEATVGKDRIETAIRERK
jgi:hypothetical protein